jgi:predicted ATPase/DNA-binding SARP family transcriptional activator
VSLTSLVGHEREILDLSALLQAQRLVTLTGVGGSGKTRLAAELALRLDWRQADSVAWVELASCTEPQNVSQSTASALSLRVTQAGDLLDAIVDALQDRELLLVLDDCEHLVDAAAALARGLLVRCPRLRILATSREPLGIAGEHVWPVPPIAPREAVQLFVERASAARSGLELNLEVVGEICRRLDGLPLAIELAAARVRVLTPEQIAERLEDRFAILTGGSRTTLPRHRTLRAAIDWSFALLSPDEQTLLARLSIFAGGFTLEAAEAVCGADLDRLTGLVDKSLVGTTSRRAAIRYHLLETIREYARERLEASGESVALHRQHCVAFLQIARQVVIDPMGEVLQQLDRLDADHDNLRAALSWSLEHAPDALAQPLAAALRWYWYYRILWGEGLRWMNRVLERTSGAATLDRAAVLAAAGTYASYLGQLDEGIPRLEEAEAILRTLPADRDLGLALTVLAHALAVQGNTARAASLADEALTRMRVSGTPYDVGYCLTNAVAFIADRDGRPLDADRALAEAEGIWTTLRHPLGLPLVLNARAMLALRQGDLHRAAGFAQRALAITRAQREVWFTTRSLRVLAAVSLDEPHRAARLLGAADALLRGIGARVLPHEIEFHAQLLERVRTACGSAFESALEEGGLLGFDPACELGLSAFESTAEAGETSTLCIADLGALEITLEDKPVDADGRASSRARELLVYLAVHDGATKDEVGVAFWPDATTDQVKNSFHVTLHRLRKMLGGSGTVAQDGTRYRLKIPHRVRSREFESAVTAAMRAPDAESLTRALALYQGDFLQGEDVGEWCFPLRARLRLLMIRGLFALGQTQEGRGQYADATESYSRVLSRDPFHEAAARQLMLCRARLGARSESLQVYRELEQRLRTELHASPEPETVAVYERVRKG